MTRRPGAFSSTRHPVEEPVTVSRAGPGGSSETVTTHPAFGQIGVSRVSGLSALYGSDFLHNGYMVIRIYGSELHRTLSRDWPYAKRTPIVEVALSEAQWATFVSSPNMGDGVQCTLTHVNGTPLPSLPDPISRAEQYGDEVKRKLTGALESVASAIRDIEALDLPAKKTASLRERLTRMHMELSANVPFVAASFEKHVEETVEKAKAEIHGYMVGALQRAGLEALAGGALPLQIEARVEEPESE